MGHRGNHVADLAVAGDKLAEQIGCLAGRLIGSEAEEAGRCGGHRSTAHDAPPLRRVDAHAATLKGIPGKGV